MSRPRQPFRETAGLEPATGKLQEAVKDWITRQWAATPTPFGTPVGPKTTDYGAREGELVLCDATAAAFTVWLPSIRTVGAVVSVKDVSGSANVVTVAPSDPTATIGGSGSVPLSLYAGSAFVALTPTLWGQM